MWNRWIGSSSPRLRPLPLYVGGYFAFFLAANSLYYAGGTPSSQIAAAILVAAGLICGFWLRARPALRWAGLLIGALVTALGVLLTPFGWVQATAVEFRVAFCIVWLVSFLAFGACSDDSVLFLLIPSIGMLIASSTEGSDPAITAYTLGFCLVCVFVLVCHANLRGRTHRRVRTMELPAGNLSLRQSVLNQVTLAGLSFMATAGLALLLVFPLRIGGAYLRPMITGTHLPVGANRRAAAASQTQHTAAGAFRGTRVLVGQGPVTPGNTPVMRVLSPVRDLLLGKVYTSYTTQGWEESANPYPPIAVRSPRGFLIHRDRYDRKLPLVRQEIQLVAPTNVAPAHPHLAGVVFRNGAGQALPDQIRLDSFGTVQFDNGVSPPFRYIAFSRLPPPLNQVSDDSQAGPSPEPTIPPVVPQQLKKLASSLKARTNAGTVRNVVAFLQRRCTYDLSAPAVPPGRDAVDFFIFTSRVGYCDLFASSAALLLQLDGIPARYCTGYAPGKQDPATGIQLITSAESHAWIEVFIPGHGWIDVDPTPPGFHGPFSLAVRLRDLLSKLHLRIPSPDFAGVMILLAIAVAFYLAYQALPAVARRRLARKLALGPVRTGPILEYWKMHDLLSRAGLPRRRDETAHEYAARISQLNLPAEIDRAVQAITGPFIIARYGRTEHLPPDDAQSGKGTALSDLRAALRRPETRRLLRARKTDPVAASRDSG